jgi:hypothetical protein
MRISLETGFHPTYKYSHNAKPIQSGEENVLQSIPKIKKKKTWKNQNLPPKTMK